MTIRYTSDLHFNHPMVAGLRGFDPKLNMNGKVRGDVEAHDRVIIENFNHGVREDDLTIIAGDFALNWKGVEDKLAQLKGRIVLVNGNHDVTSSIHKDGWKRQAEWIGKGKFEAIVDFMPRRSGNREFLISHYPYEGEGNRNFEQDRCIQFRLRDEGMWLLHGHTHSKEKVTPWEEKDCFYCGLKVSEGCTDQEPRPVRQIHVGLDAWDLRPAGEQEILDLMNSLDGKQEELVR